MHCRPFFFGAVLALLLSSLALAGPKPVELSLSSKTLSPTTTFEIHFTAAMVSRDVVGKPDQRSPLVFQPALKGSFTWLDPHRGVFEPAEVMPLGTTYQLSLRKGLNTADGQPFREPWHGTVSTPPMRLESGRLTSYFDRKNALSKPEIILNFNADVAPKTTTRFLKFVNPDGREIAAQTRTPEKDYYGDMLFQQEGASSGNPPSWRTQARPSAGPSKEPKPYGNELLVQPATPLPPGDGWKLVVSAGLPADGEPLHLADAAELPVGDVKPFLVTNAEAQNYVHSGKHLVVNFSKALDREVTPKNVTNWIKVDPVPDDLKIETFGTSVQFNGSFELGKSYHVTVDPAVPCSDTVPMTAPFTKDLVFEKVLPRLYFQEFATHQLASGSRQFHLLTVNAPGARITAKLINPGAASAALNAWQKYERDWDAREKADPDEPYQQIDGANLPGKVVFQKDFPITVGVDERKEITLDWNEILGAGHTGVVLLSAEVPASPVLQGKRPSTQAIVQVTDLGVVWKGSRHETFLYVFSLATGKAVEGAKLELFDEKNQKLVSGNTDRSGTARIAQNDQGKWLLVRQGADEHLIPFTDRDTINLTRYHLDDSGEEVESEDFTGLESDEKKVFLFTERDVYRPGEIVHLKGVERDFSTGAARVPAGEKLHLTMADSRGRTLLDQDVTISEMGGFDLDIPLTGSSLGSYIISARLPQTKKEGEGGEEQGDLATRVVQVEEYAPNPFEITINGPKTILGATPVQFQIAAKYYMGKPLSKASLKWTMRAHDTNFAPQGFDEFVFCDHLYDFRLRQELDRLSDFTEQGEADLSATGAAMVKSSIPTNPKAPAPREAHLLCEITDLDQQTVSADQAFTVDSSDFYLGLHQFPGVVREGTILPIQLIAVNRDGQPVDKPLPATVSLTRIDWQTNRIEGAGQSADFNSKPRLVKVGESVASTVSVTRVGHKWKNTEDALSGSTLVADQPGQYLIQATARDGASRSVITTSTFYVYGRAQTVWNYRNPFQIELVPDKESYTVGDTARILVKTPISGDALVTVERENVRRSFVTNLQGNAPSIEIPVEDADAPNVYVSVTLLRGANDSTHQIRKPEYRVGYTRLNIERPATKLTVYVRPDSTAHRPGDPVTLTAEVLDYQSKPVPNAEITLYASDEGVLSLTGYQTPNLLEFFNRERALGVHTGLTLPQMLGEDPDDRDYANKGFLIGDKGGEDRVRKNFQACAFWAASLHTGPDGRAIGNFNAPDGLTRYRIIAVAQTVKNQFGSAESAFEINKPVMLEPAPPRFANVGDKLMLRAVVHNATDLGGDAEVRLDLDDTVAAANPVRHIALPAQGSVALDFPVEFKKAGDAKWKWSVQFTASDGATSYRDAAEVKLKVAYPAPARHEIHFARIDEAKPSQDVIDSLAPDMLDGTGTMQVSITNSRVIELGEAIRNLLEYPYGCVEQTTSNMLPWLALRSLRPAIPDLNKSDEEITRAVDRGIDRLLTMVTESGGLSYWPHGERAELWASAYGGLGMALANRAGYSVPPDDFDRLCKYLSEQLRGLSSVTATEDFSSRCLALYALAVAGRPEAGYHELLYGKRDKLSAENRALLALAIIESHGPEAMVTDLLDTTKPAPANPDDFHWFGCASRQTALQLFAWTRFKSDSPAVDQFATDLIGLRSGGHWLTTQGNAWSVLALGDYVEHVEKPATPSAGTISWGNRSLPFHLDRQLHAAQTTWPLDAGAATDPVQMANQDHGRLYAEVRLESRPRLIDQPRQDSGYSLQRAYYKVADNGSISPLKNPVVGDRVIVALHLVVRKPATYVALEDPLPSILEAINPKFESQATNIDARVLSNWESDYNELREDRALFFRDQLDTGEYTIAYLARVRAAGTAIAPSAKVEEMYHPERFGQTETLRLTSLPLK